MSSLPVFILLTICALGGCAALAGHAMAGAWRPAWLVAVYMLILGLGDRFLAFALFGASLLSPAGYLLDSAVLVGLALLSHRITLAGRMARQYPWVYQRAGLFGWKVRESRS